MVMAGARHVVMVLLNSKVVAVPPCHPPEVTGKGSEVPFWLRVTVAVLLCRSFMQAASARGGGLEFVVGEVEGVVFHCAKGGADVEGNDDELAM